MKDRIARYKYRYNRLNQAIDRLFASISSIIPTFQDLVFNNRHPINNYHGFVNPDVFFLPPYSTWFTVISYLPLFGFRLTYLGRYSYTYDPLEGVYRLVLIPLYETLSSRVPVLAKVVETSGNKRTYTIIVLQEFSMERWRFEGIEDVYPTPFFAIKVSGPGRSELNRERLLSLLRGYVDVNTRITDVEIKEDIEGMPIAMGHVETTEYLEISVSMAHGMPVNNVFED